MRTLPGSSASPADENIETAPLVNQEQTDANPASSSPAEDADAKKPEAKTVLDIVRDVVKAKPEGDSSEPDSTVAKPKAAETSAEKGAEPEAEDDKPPPFHKHPRWVRLNERNRELGAEIETLRPQAEQFRAVEQYMTANSLAPDDIVRGFAIMAAVRNEPQRAIKELETVLTELRETLGEILPQDLQDAVDEGEMTEERALELSRTRATARTTQEKLQTRDQTDREQQQAQRAQEQRRSYAEAVESWMADRRQNDADFETVARLWADRVQVVANSLRQQGKTSFTQAEIRNICDQSYSYVRETLKPLKPQPSRVVSRAGASNSSAPAAAPAALPRDSSMLDVVKRALGK